MVLKKKNTKVTGYTLETKGSDEQVRHRNTLYELFLKHRIPTDQLLINLGLFMRSSQVVKMLFINELYQEIKHIPGIIVEFGVWWGQNMVLFENFRAIYEPFNQERRVIGFDTFEGYPSISNKDRPSDTIKRGGYTVGGGGYKEYLDQLIAYHEQNNILANIKKHQTIKGDAAKTVPKFLKDNPETIIALAYFDMALYEPTKKCLEAILPHMIPGSVVMLDEFNSREYPGETIAFKKVFKRKKVSYSAKLSQYMPGRTIITLK